MGFLSPKLEACSSGVFNPTIHNSLFWATKRCECPHHAHNWMTPLSPHWLLKMSLQTGSDGSSHCSNLELKNTNSTHAPKIVGFFGNEKHLERQFWFKTDSEFWDTSTADLSLCRTWPHLKCFDYCTFNLTWSLQKSKSPPKTNPESP